MTCYAARLTRDDNDTWLVSFPDFPEAHTFGETEEEALGHAVDALITAIEARMTDREPIPAPSSRGRGRRLVRIPPLVDAKVRLYQTMRAQRIGKAELARRLEVHPPQVDRLLSLRHQSRLEQLDAAFRVLGKTLTVEIVDTHAA